jgi:hypothetical protein
LGRRISGVQDLLVSLRIAARTGVDSRETLSGLSSLLSVVSMYNHGKFVDGDISARVRDGGECSGVMVWRKTDGGVEGDVRGSGDVKMSRRGGSSGATRKRTGC